MKSHDKKAAARFDGWAKTYGEDRISRWFGYYQSSALSKLNLDKDSWFLDVGCGPGAAVRQVSDLIPEGRACGIDISPNMVDKAKRLSEDKQNVEFQVASSESIPYPSESFDSIICTCSFHHYGDPVKALREIRRVLRPNGMFILIDSARDVYFPIWLQDRYRRYFERSHVTYYTTSEIRSLLEQADWNLACEIETFREFMQLGKVFTGLMMAQCIK